MKNNNFLSLDLEMNQPSGKIIQVGVCIANQDTIDAPIKKMWHVDPEEEITDFITNLTGITNEDIKNHSVPHTVVAQELVDLIIQYKCFINPVTWGGGDSQILINEFNDRGITFNAFGRRWIDVKTIHVFLEMCKGKTLKGGLRSAMGARKMQFIGEAHRADVDAHNTLRFFFHMIKNQTAIMETLNTIPTIQF
jgi:inhibitor of KinA sporulation pathway (predicted exonuclease)